jgi:hypothetical protein
MNQQVSRTAYAHTYLVNLPLHIPGSIDIFGHWICPDILVHDIDVFPERPGQAGTVVTAASFGSYDGSFKSSQSWCD